tara:strand:+ start:102 stop:896 length:795 start_codon:yes stop_codon:yes gene_type:complete
MMTENKSDSSEKRKRRILEDLPAIAGAVIVALIIRTFVFQSFYVPSDSMFPSLLVGDHLFVSKFTFGAKIPGTEVHLPDTREPRRGDVIVFRLARDGRQVFAPDLRPDLKADTFIKRLVGLPGDRVEIKNGRLHLNGEVVPARLTGDSFVDSRGRLFNVLQEDLGDCRHLILDDPQFPGLDMPEMVVQEGRYFFLGDNRDNSLDSRRWGTVKSTAMYGPAGLLYWSWNWTGTWLELLNPITWWNNLTGKTRWDRIGDMIGCESI